MERIRNLRVVTIGGGTGMSQLLRGLKKYFSNITAIVAVADDGARAGAIRKDFNILAPSDVRKCVVALAQEEDLYYKVLSYRFPHGRGLKGHTLGNLMLVALEDITGSFKKAVEELSKILNIKGKVLPATYEDVILSAKLKNGKTVWGESSLPIAGHRHQIEKVSLHPESAKANPEAIIAIEKADLILIGPGSLYSSVIPNFLLKDITQAVVKSKAKKIYICNVSTERGETEDFGVEEHVEKLISHTHPNIFQSCLVNSKVILKSSGKRLGEVKNITTDKEKVGKYEIIKEDVIDEENPLFHNSIKLAKAIMEV